jgi:acyl-CoA hydrolase
MTKKITCVGIILCTILSGFVPLYAQQLNLKLRFASPVYFGTNHLWDVDVIKTDNTPIEVTLKVVVKSSTGQPLVEASSAPIKFIEPFTTLSNANVTVNSLLFFNKDLERSNQVSRSFPAGEYVYCIYALNNATGETKAQYCTNISVRNLTPPILIYPFNQSTIQEKNPMLNWLAPGAISADLNIKYHLTLVELYPKQKANDGLVRNRPIVDQTAISTTTMQYPFNAPALIYGKQYAWQVEAYKENNQPLGVSEVWSFTLAPDSLKEVSINTDQSYIDIVQSASSAVYYAKGVLKLKYNTRKYPLKMTYQVFDMQETLINHRESVLMALSQENWYDIDMEKELKLKHEHRYRFELFDGKNLYKLYFTYLNPVRSK